MANNKNNKYNNVRSNTESNKSDDLDNKNKEELKEKGQEEEDEEKKKNKKIFIVVGTAIAVVILIILILLLLTFCKHCSAETEVTETQAIEITQESEEQGQPTETTEETSAQIEETTPVSEETSAETVATTNAKETKIAPTISLTIQQGPVYSAADNVCYYRVKANVTGTPTPTIAWSRDDSEGAWGRDVAQVNLHSPTETYTLTATATNSAGSDNASITLSWGCNRPPIVQQIDPIVEFYTGLVYAINAFATDPDGDALTYQWNVTCGSIASPNASRILWTAPSTPCSGSITVTVSDGRGGTDSLTEEFIVTMPNWPPTLSEIVIKELKTGNIVDIFYINEHYNLSITASDSDGDPLTYSWSATGGTINNPNVNPTTWIAPSTQGNYTITVNVNDGRGGTASKSRNIYVRKLFD